MKYKKIRKLIKEIKGLQDVTATSLYGQRLSLKILPQIVQRLELELLDAVEHDMVIAEHLQKLIAAIESEKPDENLTRSVSEAKAALGLYQVTL